jgi:hypothetical protein
MCDRPLKAEEAWGGILPCNRSQGPSIQSLEFVRKQTFVVAGKLERPRLEQQIFCRDIGSTRAAASGESAPRPAISIAATKHRPRLAPPPRWRRVL